MNLQNESKILQEVFEQPSITKKLFILSRIKDKGLPIIEKYTEDSSLVTVLFFGDETVNTVSVFGELFGTNEPVFLDKIDGTDVYYRSFIFPNNSRSLYVFFINETDDQEFEDIDVRIDPFNPKINICTEDPAFPNEYATLFKEESILELPKCTTVYKKKYTPKHSIIELSAVFKENNRRFWLYSNSKKPKKLFIFFDGYEYLYETSSIQIIDQLEKDTLCLFLDNRLDRMGDLLYNDDYVHFIENEVFGIVAKFFDVPNEVVLVGFSLGANLAMYMTIKYNYKHAVLQSGAFYYNDENIKEHFLFDLMNTKNKKDINWYMTCGKLEQQFHEFYEEILLIKEKSYFKDSITYLEHPGGHTYFDCDFTLKDGVEYFTNK